VGASGLKGIVMINHEARRDEIRRPEPGLTRSFLKAKEFKLLK